MVSSSSQADVVDLNTIPSNLLQRMDVVTGGASATYGSAATAGMLGIVELDKLLLQRVQRLLLSGRLRMRSPASSSNSRSIR